VAQHSEFSTNPQSLDCRGSIATKQKRSNSRPAEFRSSDCKEHPDIKQKGSTLASFRSRFRTCKIQKFRLQGASSYQAKRINLARFRNCNQSTKFRSLNYKEHPATKQKGSTLQASETFSISKIQSSDCKEHPATKREGSEIAEFQKGVNHLQIRSKEH